VKRHFFILAGVLSGAALLWAATAPRVPEKPSEVAEPGGTLPGNPKIALVKIADGFLDPTSVASANDGSGRIFVT